MTASDSATDETGDLRHEAHAWVISLTSGRVTQGDARPSASGVRAARNTCERSSRRAISGRHSAVPPLCRWSRRPWRRSRRGVSVVAGSSAVRWPASVALFVLRPSLLDHGLGGADYVTAVGEQRQVQVSGETRIEMNTRTRLNVRRNQEQQETIELLGGEAEIIASHRRRAACG
ncbi:transmembrane sensor [Pseudomonas aeruginosa]|nr:transmembrane sensor [Pseudomonas aeruginosa]